MLVAVTSCRPKKITFAMRKIWNGATYSLRVPLVQASDSSPGWLNRHRTVCSTRASMLVKAWSSFSETPRRVRSAGTTGSSPHAEQYRACTGWPQVGQVHPRPFDGTTCARLYTIGARFGIGHVGRSYRGLICHLRNVITPDPCLQVSGCPARRHRECILRLFLCRGQQSWRRCSAPTDRASHRATSWICSARALPVMRSAPQISNMVSQHARSGCRGSPAGGEWEIFRIGSEPCL